MYDKFLVNFLKNNVIANDARRVRAPAGKGQSFHALMPNIATAEINEDGSCVYEIPDGTSDVSTIGDGGPA